MMVISDSYEDVWLWMTLVADVIIITSVNSKTIIIIIVIIISILVQQPRLFYSSSQTQSHPRSPLRCQPPEHLRPSSRC